MAKLRPTDSSEVKRNLKAEEGRTDDRPMLEWKGQSQTIHSVRGGNKERDLSNELIRPSVAGHTPIEEADPPDK